MGLFNTASYALRNFSYGSYYSNPYSYSYAPSFSSYSSSYAPISFRSSYAPSNYYGVGASYSTTDYGPKSYSYSSYAPTSTAKFGTVTRKKKTSSRNYSYDSAAANFLRTSGVSLKNIPSSFINQYGVKETVLPDGRKVLACRWSRFNNAQREWVDTLKYFEQAAADLGCDLVYSDVERTVAESNAGRAKKGALVCRGGESPHNYGVAADFVLFKNGKAVDVNSSLQKSVIDRAIALSGNKIESGIYWRKKGERHHIELRGWRPKYKNTACLVG